MRISDWSSDVCSSDLEAIAWSWELLTEVYKLDRDRMYGTVFEGDNADGLPKDEEAYGFWTQIVPEDRILLGNKKDNRSEERSVGQEWVSTCSYRLSTCQL